MAGATLLALFSGIPIAFALGGVATIFMMIFMPLASLDTIAQNVYEELASITLLTIPLFILKGAAIGKSRAGKDLYDALHTWLHRVPGGLGVAVVLACGLFAAMAGSSPATCSAIGSSGIPEMRRRGYSPGFAAGLVAAGGTLGILLPPSIVLILYAVASEQSLGRLFLAGLGPGVLLVLLFASWAVVKWRLEYGQAFRVAEAGGVRSEILRSDTYSMRDRFLALPRVLPFLLLLGGVMIALYGGIATPSETAGLGAVLALLLIALIYGAWRLRDLKPIFAGTLGESGMLLMIIGMSLLYSYVMSYLHISQATAGVDRGAGVIPLVAAGGDPGDGGRARVLPAASIHHPDDRAHHSAPAAGRRVRPGLVRGRDGGGDGDGADPPASRPQHLRHQPHRARHRAWPDHPRHVPLRDPDGDRCGDSVVRTGDRDVAAGRRLR